MSLPDLSSHCLTALLDIVPEEGGTGINIADPGIASLLTFTAATLPIYVGLFLPRLSGRWEGSKKSLLIGVGIGVLFASFFDLMKETAGISTSTLKNVTDFLNVVALGAGLLAFFFIHAYERTGENQSGSLALLYLWALLGIGFHSVGEGVVIGYDFTSGATVLSLAQISSFTLHKAAEGFTIGLVFVEGRHTWRQGGLSGLLGGFPVVLGTLAGISGLSATLATYFFAVGGGATIYMVTRFVPLAGSSRSKSIVGVFLGFLYMYLAGVLHQFE